MDTIKMPEEDIVRMFPPPDFIGKSAEEEKIDKLSKELAEVAQSVKRMSGLVEAVLAKLG